MKILFLDHDGVMATVTEFGGRAEKKKNYLRSNVIEKDYPVQIRFDDFNIGCVKCLNEIIAETDCEIVVTSDWRTMATLEEMQTLYFLYGVNKKPIGFTPKFEDIESKNSKRKGFHSRESKRKYEILEFISKNKKDLNIEGYCVVDDMELEVLAGMNNCVLTDDLLGISNSFGNNGNGYIKQEIIDYLNKKI